MDKFSSGAHWRDSSRYARFFIIDARAAFPLFVFILHIRLWTFIISLVATLFFAALERYGFSLNVFVRWLRNFLAGPEKTASPWWK